MKKPKPLFDLSTKEGMAAYQKEYAHKNRERIRENKRAYYRANREPAVVNQKERRAEKRKVAGYVNHAFDPITDKCERCGLERRQRALLVGVGRFANEYKVSGKWTSERPTCGPVEENS